MLNETLESWTNMAIANLGLETLDAREFVYDLAADVTYRS